MASIFDQAFDPNQFGLGRGFLPPELEKLLAPWLAQQGAQFPGQNAPQLPPQAAPAGPAMGGPQMPFQPNMDNPERDFFNPASGMTAGSFGSLFNPQQQAPMGGPPGMAPQGPQQQPAQAPGGGILGAVGAPTGGGFLSSIMGNAGNVVSDFFTSPSHREGPIGNMFVQNQQRAAQNATLQFMQSKGVTPQQAQFLMANPEALKTWVAQNSPINRPPELKDIKTGGAEVTMQRDPVTGAIKPLNIPGFQMQPDPKVAAELRKNFENLPESRAYSVALPIYKSMVETVQRPGVPTRASDLNLVYGIAKLFDPQSSVREGEMINVQNTQGLTDKIMGILNGVIGGANLQAPVRQALLAEARSRMEQYRSGLATQVKRYAPIAQRQNIPVADFAPDLELPELKAAPPPPDPGALPRVSTPE